MTWSPGAARNGPWLHEWPGAECGAGYMTAVLRLAADVDVVGLVDQVEAALAMADQVGEQAHGVVTHGLDGVGAMGLGALGQAAADAVGDLGVLAAEPGDAVGQAGGVLHDLVVEAAGGLGDLDVDREHLLQALQGRDQPGREAVLAAEAVGVLGSGQGHFQPGDGPPEAEPLPLGRLQGAGRCLVRLADLTLLHTPAPPVSPGRWSRVVTEVWRIAGHLSP